MRSLLLLVLVCLMLSVACAELMGPKGGVPKTLKAKRALLSDAAKKSGQKVGTYDNLPDDMIESFPFDKMPRSFYEGGPKQGPSKEEVKKLEEMRRQMGLGSEIPEDEI